MTFTEMQVKESRTGSREGNRGHEFTLRNVHFELPLSVQKNRSIKLKLAQKSLDLIYNTEFESVR